MVWNRDRNCEYHHYEAAQECERIMDKIMEEIKELNLTSEESTYAWNNMDMNVAEDIYGRY